MKVVFLLLLTMNVYSEIKEGECFTVNKMEYEFRLVRAFGNVRQMQIKDPETKKWRMPIFETKEDFNRLIKTKIECTGLK